MKNIIYITIRLAIPLLVFLSACTKDLDVKPTSVITSTSFWKTEDDVIGALNGMYVNLRSSSENIFLSGEERSEVFQTGPIGGHINLHNNALTPDMPGIANWTGFYKIVHSANLILKYVPNTVFKSEQNKNNILAQAYTMRAYVYFVMSKTWGELVLHTEPIESSDPAKIQKPRSSLTEVFKLIKSDLDSALSLYPDNSFPPGRGYWTKAGANTLKADVYLWTGKTLGGGVSDFTIALDAIEEVEAADVGLLTDFADIFKYSNKGNRETIMNIRYDELDGLNNFFWFMWIIDASIPATIDGPTNALLRPVGGGQDLLVLTDLVRGQFTSDDTRKAASFFEIYYGPGGTTYYESISLKGAGIVTGGSRVFSSDIILYRYADVLLMKAEAKNALNIDPSDEMNAIRQRGYGPAQNHHVFVNGTKSQNDDAILQERLFELLYEGKRWWDLVRFGKAFELVPTLQGRESETHLLLFPIATAVRNLEPLVEQNQGY